MTDINNIVTNDQIIKFENILSDMVVKLCKEAEALETNESAKNYQSFKDAALERSKITDYSFDINEISRMVPRLSLAEAEAIHQSVSNIFNICSKEEIERVLELKRIVVCKSYNELNPYYRKIMGKPPLEHTKDDFIYINGIPIHELSIGDINALKFTGELNLIIIRNKDNEGYDYLKYLDKNIDVWKARESGLFEVLSLPNNDDCNEYRKYYNEERKVFLRTYSSKYLNYSTEYNEIYELNTIKFLALSRMQMNRYSPILDKDSFTVEEAIDKWKEFGLSFPKDMPSTYRNTTTFLLNYLTLFKGTNFVMEFISKRLFTGIQLYKYYITKKPKTHIKYPVDPETPPWEIYDVEFIMVPYSEFYTEDISNENRKVLTYADVVERDPKWQDTEELKRAVFSEDFSFVESHYLGMNFYVDLHRFSLDFSTMINLFLNHRETLSSISIYYPTAGTNETFFNLFVYFLDLFGYLLTRTHVKDPNTLEKYRHDHVYGFNVPDDIEWFRVQFIKFFFNTEYRKLLNDFPNAINDNDDFFTMVETMDDQVRFVENFDKLIRICDSHVDYYFLNRLIRLVTLIRTNPTVLQMSDQTVDGMTYTEYLRKNAPMLYSSLTYLIGANIEQKFVLEFDLVTQLLIDALDRDTTDTETMVGKLQQLLSDASIFINGVNKYLLYVLKLFKSYSAEFLTEEADFNITTEGNHSIQIDQILFDVDAILDDDINNATQIDRVNIEWITPKYNTINRTKDAMILKTYYGDVELETR